MVDNPEPVGTEIGERLRAIDESKDVDVEELLLPEPVTLIERIY